ncbi:MAG: universal stress protein [Halobacteriales archaeon]
MTTVLVPVRYPLTEHSRRTLEKAIDVAEDRGAELVVLHVSLYHYGEEVTGRELKAAVESEFGRLPNARFHVDRAFIVEDQILEEIVAEDADVVVLGHKQLGRWRRAINRLVDDPDVAEYLQDKVDVEFVIVEAP